MLEIKIQRQKSQAETM